MFGPVASDPTVSRTIDRLAADSAAALAAIDTARAAARAQAWALAGDARSRPRHRRRPTAGHRRGCHPGHRPLGEARRGADVQEAGSGTIRCGRSSTTARPAPGSRWRCCCARATPARTPPPTTSPCIRAALRQLPGASGRAPARPQGPGPGRRRRRHPRAAGLAARAAAVLLGRVRPDPSTWSTSSPRCPPRTGRPAYDADGEPRPGAWVIEVTGLLDLTRLADRDAGDRPQGAPAPRRAAAADRPRRAPLHRVRHQHPPRRPRPPARRPRTAPPPPRPRRGPHPRREGHRADATCRCTSWTRTGSGAPSSRWPARSPPGRRCSPSPSTPPGAGNPNDSGCGCSPSPAQLARHARRTVLHLPAHAPWAGLLLRRPHPAARARRSRLSTDPAVPTTQEPDRPVEPAPTRATSAELSYPPGRISPATPASTGRRSSQHRATKDPG